MASRQDMNTPPALTPEQERAIGCAPTIVGLTANTQGPAGGSFNNVGRAPGGIGYNITATGNRAWTGLNAAGVAPGTCQQFHLTDASTATLTLQHQDPASTAANRFSLPNGQPLVLTAGEHAVFQHNGTSWVLVGEGDSEPTAPAPLTARQLQQLGCVPTTVGMNGLGGAQPGTGTPFPPGGVGYRWSDPADQTIFGLLSGVVGDCVHFYNANGTGGKNLRFINQSGGATPALARFVNPERTNYDLKPGNFITFQRDLAGVWVCTNVAEGE